MNGKDVIRFTGSLVLLTLINAVLSSIMSETRLAYGVNVLLAMGLTILGAIRETRP